MKKLFFIACACAACAAFAADTEIKCGNDVGMLTINNSTATDLIVAVPFGELATGGSVCASNIVKTANLKAGDDLYVYDPSTKGWTAWELTEATGGYLYWKSVGTATIDVNGNISYGTSDAANETFLVPGSAIWIKRQNPSGPFYVYGSYVSSLSTTASVGAYNLVANPLDDDFNLQGETKGDMVLRVISSNSTKRYRWNGSEWGYQDATGGVTKVGATLTIPSGQGFWLNPKKTRTFNWR